MHFEAYLFGKLIIKRVRDRMHVFGEHMIQKMLSEPLGQLHELFEEGAPFILYEFEEYAHGYRGRVFDGRLELPLQVLP